MIKNILFVMIVCLFVSCKANQKSAMKITPPALSYQEISSNLNYFSAHEEKMDFSIREIKKFQLVLGCDDEANDSKNLTYDLEAHATKRHVKNLKNRILHQNILKKMGLMDKVLDEINDEQYLGLELVSSEEKKEIKQTLSDMGNRSAEFKTEMNVSLDLDVTSLLNMSRVRDIQVDMVIYNKANERLENFHSQINSIQAYPDAFSITKLTLDLSFVGISASLTKLFMDDRNEIYLMIRNIKYVNTKGDYIDSFEEKIKLREKNARVIINMENNYRVYYVEKGITLWNLFETIDVDVRRNGNRILERFLGFKSERDFNGDIEKFIHNESLAWIGSDSLDTVLQESETYMFSYVAGKQLADDIKQIKIDKIISNIVNSSDVAYVQKGDRISLEVTGKRIKPNFYVEERSTSKRCNGLYYACWYHYRVRNDLDIENPICFREEYRLRVSIGDKVYQFHDIVKRDSDIALVDNGMTLKIVFNIDEKFVGEKWELLSLIVLPEKFRTPVRLGFIDLKECTFSSACGFEDSGPEELFGFTDLEMDVSEVFQARVVIFGIND